MFDCSFRPQNGTRSIHYMGHVQMMAAVQPFISGAISKTINMPEECTVEDIMDAYTESWKLGLKAVAIYRDNSKRVQPLSSGSGKGEKKNARPLRPIVGDRSSRRSSTGRCAASCRTSGSRSRTSSRSAATKATSRSACTRTARPGEIFITMAKEGSTISGLMDSFATAVSYALQYGVPLKFLVDKFSHVRFEPSGWTGNATVPYAKSIMDYIFRWLGAKFLGPEYAVGEAGETPVLRPTEPSPQQALPFEPAVADAPLVRGVRLDHDAQRKLLQVRQLRRHERLQLISPRCCCVGEGDPVTSDTGSPFFVMELIFLIVGVVVGALGCWLVMRARFFEPLRAETERRARAEAQASRLPELETRVSELQIVNTDLQAEKRVLAEAQARLLDSFQALSAQALQANNQMFLDLADTALAKRQMAIDELVRPLKESLTKVDSKIQELETARVSAYSMLTSQLQSLGTETTNLVKALRTPHTRGQWGEMQLRRAVEMAGMVDYCDFRVAADSVW